jgi:hypothetical protein
MEVAIQISPKKPSTKIPSDHTLNVYHWYDFEDDSVTELLSFGRAQVIDKTMQQPTSLCLSRM